MPLILPANTLADAAFSVDNSCRFNDGDSPNMNKTPGSSGSNSVFTFSAWLKRGDVASGAAQTFWSNGGAGISGGQGQLSFGSDNKLNLYDGASVVWTTNRLFRDPGAWFHILVSCNSGASGSAKARFWLNGTEETSFATDNRSSFSDLNGVNQSGEIMYVGSGVTTSYYDGYMAEVVLLDNTAVTGATDFGEFDEDSPTIWKPKDVSGLTFGTHGFYLDFKDSANLGNDANGGTDLTETNIAAVDQSQDSPTNNFCVLNPLDGTISASGGLAEGNTTYNKTSTGAGHNTSSLGTMGVSSGKWYWELKITDSSDVMAGFLNAAHGAYDSNNTLFASANTASWGWRANGDRYISATGTGSHFNTYTTNDILSFAIDLDNNKCYAAKNGTWEDSGDPTSGATGTGSFADLPGGIFIVPAIANHSYGAATLVHMNFGNGCFGDTALSSAVADGNGYGLFEYAPPSGYLSLCTKNLGSDGG